MPGENLTRIEAEERAALVTVHDYDVVLDVTTGPEVFRSPRRRCGSPRPRAPRRSSTRSPPQVHSVTLNGVALDPAEVSDGVRIQLPSLAAENELVVVADGRYMNTGEGLHRFVDPVDGEVYLYTQFEVPDSRRMFAVFEQPDLKADVPLHGHGARALGGRVQLPHARAASDAARGCRRPGRSSRRRASRATSPRSSPARTRSCATSSRRPTAASSRSACSAARASRSTSTPTTSSRRPSRASSTSRRSSACPTRSRSTTSSSCPSTTPAPWRTRARSPSPSSTCSARR